MTAYVVTGPAASGKSTLGEALARRTGAVLLDLATLPNPLLEAVFAGAGGHWNDDDRRAQVPPARNAVLRDVARTQVALGHDVVLVAPFTAELRGGPEWALLRAALDPADVRVLWLTAPAAVLAARAAARGLDRDAADRAVTGVAEPRVPHRVVDATTPTALQVEHLFE